MLADEHHDVPVRAETKPMTGIRMRKFDNTGSILHAL